MRIQILLTALSTLALCACAAGGGGDANLGPPQGEGAEGDPTSEEGAGGEALAQQDWTPQPAPTLGPGAGGAGQGGGPAGSGNGGGGPAGSGNGGGGPAGSGNGGGGPAGSGNGGGGPAGSGNSGGGPAGSGGGGAGGSPPPPGCTYPAGPYGTSKGATVSPDLQWQGYLPGTDTATTIKITDFFDCDGTKGINALLVDHGTYWCSSCQAEAQEWGSVMGTWGPAGARVMTLLVETSSGGPATVQTAKKWKDAFKLSSIYVAADPSFQLQSPAADAWPYHVIINPRTMKIVDSYTGDTGDAKVLQLANSNH
jgi:hypothetical protein